MPVTIDYELIKSDRRKTISLQVKKGMVIVRAPCYVSQWQVDAFVNKKRAWLLEKVAQQKSHQQENAFVGALSFANGSRLYYQGQQRTLTIIYGNKEELQCQSQQLVITLKNRYENLPKEKLALAVRKRLEMFFKQQASLYLAQHLPQKSQETRLFSSSYQVKRYKARWGSCNNRKELSFNYLLMMVPTWVFDYVIIHELCHLKHLNHSSLFWQLVAQHCPNYLAAKEWLKMNQAHLHWN